MSESVTFEPQPREPRGSQGDRARRRRRAGGRRREVVLASCLAWVGLVCLACQVDPPGRLNPGMPRLPQLLTGAVETDRVSSDDELLFGWTPAALADEDGLDELALLVGLATQACRGGPQGR